MSVSPTDVRYLIESAHSKNISRAAERLGITQPSLSLAIRRLETEVGTPLLTRSKQGVHLTKSGQRFVAEARHLLEQWDLLKSRTLEAENEISGRFTIGCHPAVATYTLPGVLRQILSENTRLEIQFIHALSSKITEGVIQRELDFGLAINPAQHPDLVIKPIATDEVGFWRSEEKTELQDLFDGKAVLISDPALIQTQSIVKKIEKKKIRFRRTITSSNLDVIASLTAGGAGIGILPARVATRMQAYRLQRCKETDIVFKDKLALICRSDFFQSKSQKALFRVFGNALSDFLSEKN